MWQNNNNLEKLIAALLKNGYAKNMHLWQQVSVFLLAFWGIKTIAYVNSVNKMKLSTTQKRNAYLAIIV